MAPKQRPSAAAVSPAKADADASATVSASNAADALASAIFGSSLSPSHSALLRYFSLAAICITAFALRLFAVLRYESVIHEFDPYFNYRSTKYLVANGMFNFRNWFDDFTWYPLGRQIGSTVFPGLMSTSAIVWHLLQALNIPIDIKDVCVFLAPLFASLTCLCMYAMTVAVSNKRTALLAAALMAVVPGYVSRSVAGSYDNECVSIFALIFAFYWFVRAVQSGAILHATYGAVAYFYMVNCWGGYIFITNLIPLYTLGMIMLGRYSTRLYTAYSVWCIVGSLLAMQVRFVGFNALQSSEHMASYLAFVAVQLVGGYTYLRSQLEPALFAKLIRSLLVSLASVTSVVLVAAIGLGYISPWSGRLYSLLDPTYAKDHIPIIASVSEHQPTAWGSFFFDLYLLTFFMPVGLYYILLGRNNLGNSPADNIKYDGAIFMATYCLTSVYFAGVMVRLMLVLAPAAVIVSAIGISNVLDTSRRLPRTVALIVVAGIAYLMATFMWHSEWVTSEAYSSPSIVLSARGPGGQRVMFDDFREAYSWLKYNTPADAKVMSWWDYGYQITAMANRTVIVDNNTWNNTHIATVGRAMNADEETAYSIIRALDVDYVLVVFGGLAGYASDDINKFLWMVRISGSVDKNVNESDWYSSQGFYTSGPGASKTMTESLMYKMSYYRFGEVVMEYGRPGGYDRARGYDIAEKDVKLKYLEEAFTSEHWMVRIYRVKQPDVTGAR